MRASRAIAMGVCAVLLAATVAPAAGQDTTRSTRPEPVDARVVGNLVGGGGEPLAGVPVVVRATNTGAGLGELLVFSLFVGLSGGLGFLPCLFPEGCPLTSNRDGVVAETRTRGDGSYGATLPKTYVPGSETNTDWVVSADLPARAGEQSGPSSNFEFEVNIQTQEAPPLPIWDVAPTVEIDGWRVGIEGSAGPDDLAGQGVRLVSRERYLHEGGGSGTIDARLLERAAGARPGLGAMAVGNRDVAVGHANGRTIYHQRLRSAVVPVALDPVAPSRGSACSGLRRDGQPAVVTGPAGCRLTDGDFEQPLISRSAEQDERYDPFASTTTTLDPTVLTEITVELAQPIDLGLVVLHGVQDRAAEVTASADGTTWDPVPSAVDGRVVPDGVTTASPTTHLAARYVRVASDGVERIKELSVWERTPGEAAPPGPGSDPIPGLPSLGDDDDNSRAAPALLAAVLLVVVTREALRVRRRRAEQLPPPT